MVVFPPIFVADTKIIYGYDFVAPLKKMLYRVPNFGFSKDTPHNKCILSRHGNILKIFVIFT